MVNPCMCSTTIYVQDTHGACPCNAPLHCLAGSIPGAWYDAVTVLILRVQAAAAAAAHLVSTYAPTMRLLFRMSSRYSASVGTSNMSLYTGLRWYRRSLARSCLVWASVRSTEKTPCTRLQLSLGAWAVPVAYKIAAQMVHNVQGPFPVLAGIWLMGNHPGVQHVRHGKHACSTIHLRASSWTICNLGMHPGRIL